MQRLIRDLCEFATGVVADDNARLFARMYRPQFSTGTITPNLLKTVRRAASVAGSWRSDSGHVAFDVGGELLRHALLDAKGSFDAASVRECFLFPDTYQAIRTKMQPAGQ